MKTITLTDRSNQPIHSRRVSNEVFASASLAKVVGGRIIAIYAADATLPQDRFGIAPIVNGVIRYPDYLRD